MAREPRDPRRDLDQPGQRPLLQGHLPPGGPRRGDDPELAENAAPEPSVQPASDVAKTPADAVRGKATRSPADVATRPHLEGSEQGPS